MCNTVTREYPSFASYCMAVFVTARTACTNLHSVCLDTSCACPQHEVLLRLLLSARTCSEFYSCLGSQESDEEEEADEAGPSGSSPAANPPATAAAPAAAGGSRGPGSTGGRSQQKGKGRARAAAVSEDEQSEVGHAWRICSSACTCHSLAVQATSCAWHRLEGRRQALRLPETFAVPDRLKHLLVRRRRMLRQRAAASAGNDATVADHTYEGFGWRQM